MLRAQKFLKRKNFTGMHKQRKEKSEILGDIYIDFTMQNLKLFETFSLCDSSRHKVPG